ncbi:class II aldolase/adducin family protein [Albidovulum sediminicola]|uniref:Class II aldolase/adducin family protein n=1 Tax=Albidovulum sediminicola TaxID=2984331 RepID=A0ABT2Z1W1_9RHOB|nr:class II aldolase/adducin family protein [Defluviimonas sp. WL0075]MCV2865092.1 class II aldolase/adducin family protein [Defluviimonas sp. WL0075]
MNPAQRTRPEGLARLADLSARIGADPLLIQAAGGNTSIKDGDVMWIKASGTLLADALDRDVFVACDLPGMRAALAEGAARADQPAEFALDKDGLRPSIETSLHAVFPQAVVVHVHCVNTIALAICADAEQALARRLSAFDWAFVPYVKPGAQLAALVRQTRGPKTDVIVLGNHGLIVAADTVEAVEELLLAVVAALRADPLTQPPIDTAKLAARAGDGFEPLPVGHPLHIVAQVPQLCELATAGSLYPDHVIFCGPGAATLNAGEAPRQAVDRRLAEGFPPPVFLLVPETGALVRSDASSGARALVRCLGDVLSRLEKGAAVTHLTAEQDQELTNWDAEKYRQALNAG